jgi:hypothetical protein
MNTRIKYCWVLSAIGLILFSQCFCLVPAAKAAGSNLFVKSDGTGIDCSQNNPCEPGQAMANAVAGDTIYFMNGAYTNPLYDPYLTINKPISLVGGWNGAPSGDLIVDPDMYEVVINGGSTRSLFVVNDISGAGGLITITGFAFKYGYASPSGGAIYIQSGRVDITGNLFQENIAGSYGGAIYVGSGEDVHILNNSFVGNEVTWGGGSIFAGTSSATTLIEGNVFTGGNADYGTAIHSDNCHLVINGNLFKDNPGHYTIDLYSNSIGSTISNNFIIRSTQNSINLSGANTTSYEVINNTIMNAQFGISPTNSLAIVSNNIITQTNYSINNSTGALSGSNNLFFGNTNDPNPLTDPVYNDPVFINPSADNYHLGDESPAIDAGVVVALSEDYDGDERPIGDRFDIGADEVKGGFFTYLPFIVR